MDVTSILIQSALVLAVIAAITTLLRQKVQGALLALFFVMIFWILSTIFLISITDYNYRSLHPAIQHFCITPAATLSLYILLKFTNRANWVNKWTLLFFSIEPIIFQFVYWGNFVSDPSSKYFELLFEINGMYTICILTAGLVFSFENFANKSISKSFISGLMILGVSLPITAIANLILIDSSNIASYAVQASFIISTLIYFWNSYELNSGDISTITRQAVIETMDDGWMIVDNLERIIDINPSAEKILGVTSGGARGNFLKHTIKEWPSTVRLKNNTGELELRRGIANQNQWKYLNARFSQLIYNNREIGSLIFWHDVTNRKLEETERQTDRDELFILLNSLSGTANRSLRVEDFLSDAAYQILYTFNGQAIAIYLMNEADGKFGNRLQNITSFGFSNTGQKKIKSENFSSEINRWLISTEGHRPGVFNHKKNPADFMINLQSLAYEHIVLIPLLLQTQIDEEAIGCILLAKDGRTHISNNELIRLILIANHISSLIENNSKRQFAIALTERQRLLRDLHDSVSQKLYGLVALTEAAQAGLEAGSDISQLDVLSRIGDNARQAVKEMRLFLYEMQPIDLKDGLVSSLHHRLAAVEGRADIKARLLTDEKIQLSKDVETALYFIAQEALNNILRHAHAKNVTVKLTNKRQNIVLEVIDDGVGFDPETLDESGLGIKSMKERAARLKGKFKLSFEEPHGTKITVTMNKKELL